MDSIFVTLLISFWLIVLIPAVLAPMFMNRGPSSQGRNNARPETVAIGDRRQGAMPSLSEHDNLAA